MIHSLAVLLRVHTQHAKMINEDRFGIVVYFATLTFFCLSRAHFRCPVNERVESGGMGSLEPEVPFLCSTDEGQLNRLEPSSVYGRKESCLA